MFKCASKCVCGFDLIFCEPEARDRIGKHAAEFGLVDPFAKGEWPARCRRCGRHFLVGLPGAPVEYANLYPKFLYHSVVAWNNLRRREKLLHLVTEEELRVYHKQVCPELDWKAAMLNALEREAWEREKPGRSFLWSQPYYKLQKHAEFRVEHEVALDIPVIT